MPFTFKIDKDIGVVYQTIKGPITTKELLNYFFNIFRHPDYKPGMKYLADIREIEPSLFKKDMDAISAYLKKYLDNIGPLKVAVVVLLDSSYGMLRMLQTYLEDAQIEIDIFRDIDEARKWLQIDI